MLINKFDAKSIKDEEIRKLYNIAKSVAIPRNISKQMSAGGVGCAVLTKNGNVYTGVCIDTECSLGMCAERNALSTMITNGECDVDMIIAVNKNGKVLPPCGACREFMLQISESKDIKIIVDNVGTIYAISDLMPYQY